MTLHYPNWSLTDIKSLTYRERKHFSAMNEWVNERRRSQAQMHSAQVKG